MVGDVQKAKRKAPKRTLDLRTGNTGSAIHGLIGLELTTLRKSFNGQTKYNFDKFLEDNIPEEYHVEVVEDESKWSKLCDLQCVKNADIKCNSFAELRRSITGSYDINLTDYGPPVPDTLSDDIFLKAHDKHAKHERKFGNEDKLKVATEVDNSIELLSILGIELKKHNMKQTLEALSVDNIELNEDQIFRLSQLLGTITHIEDPTDTAEMILKYKLTIRELRTFLLNAIRIKSLEGKLKKRSIYDEEEFELFENGIEEPTRVAVGKQQDFPVSNKKQIEMETQIKSEESNLEQPSKKVRKKRTPKVKVTLKIEDTIRFQQIVDNAPKMPRKKRAPYKKRKTATTVQIKSEVVDKNTSSNLVQRTENVTSVKETVLELTTGLNPELITENKSELTDNLQNCLSEDVVVPTSLTLNAMKGSVDGKDSLPYIDAKPMDTKPMDTKPMDTNPMDTNPMDPKPMDPNPMDPKPMDPNPMDPKPVKVDAVDQTSDKKLVDNKLVDNKPPDNTQHVGNYWPSPYDIPIVSPNNSGSVNKRDIKSSGIITIESLLK